MCANEGLAAIDTGGLFWPSRSLRWLEGARINRMVSWKTAMSKIRFLGHRAWDMESLYGREIIPNHRHVQGSWPSEKSMHR